MRIPLMIRSRRRRIVLTVLFALALGGVVVYRRFNASDKETRSVLATVRQGIITVSVSGTGNASSDRQLELKPKVSADVLVVSAASGQAVSRGSVLLTLDQRDARKSVRDAEVNLEAAKLTLQKLSKPAEPLEILQTEHALLQATETESQAEANLAKAYEDGFNAVAAAFLDLPSVVTGVHDLLFDSTIADGRQWNVDFYKDAIAGYDLSSVSLRNNLVAREAAVKISYDRTFVIYNTTPRTAERVSIASLIHATYDTVRQTADTIKNTQNLIQFYKDVFQTNNLKPKAIADTHLSQLSSFTGKLNAHLGSLLSVRDAIEKNEDALAQAARVIAERTEALAKLKRGADRLDIASQELAIKQRTLALSDAREKLADYSLRAPFDGVLASFSVKSGDSVTPSTVIGTLITRLLRADISLNEIDAARVSVGEKAFLTLDALPGVRLEGAVIELDTVGRASQGVVNYTATIGFDPGEIGIKPGMTVSATIVVAEKADVLLVPSVAVRSERNRKTVELVHAGELAADGAGREQTLVLTLPTERVQITTGLSSDTQIEVLEGLSEGDRVVVRTLSNGNEASNNTTQPRAFGLPTPGAPGGGALRPGGFGGSSGGRGGGGRR